MAHLKKTFWLGDFKVFDQKNRWVATFALRSDAENFICYYENAWELKKVCSEKWHAMWSKPFDHPERL